MSPTDIANQALSRLGQAMVSDIAENSPSAIVCRTHYELVRDSLLRQHPWNFAVARAQLTESDETPAFGWDHQFALPSDRLRLLTLNGVQAAMCASDFETEGDYLLTDADEAKITYVRRVTDPTLFDPIFVEVLVLRLGGAIAVALTGSEQKRNELEALADAKMREATFADVGERRATVRGPVINRLASAPGEGFDRNTTYILSGEGSGSATVDNDSVNAAIEEDAAATRTSLGLGSAATSATSAFEASGAVSTHAAVTSGVHGISAFGATLVDDASASAARTTLGLGTAATTASTAYEASGAIATHAAVTSSVHGISTFGATLVDDADASAARTTLGLGTIATQAASSVSITGGSISGITDLPVADGGTGASTAADARTNLKVPASDTTGITGADAISNIVSLTQSEYDAIGSPNSSTLYVIVG